MKCFRSGRQSGEAILLRQIFDGNVMRGRLAFLLQFFQLALELFDFLCCWPWIAAKRVTTLRKPAPLDWLRQTAPVLFSGLHAVSAHDSIQCIVLPHVAEEVFLSPPRE
jgi:hypothetical protein